MVHSLVSNIELLGKSKKANVYAPMFLSQVLLIYGSRKYSTRRRFPKKTFLPCLTQLSPPLWKEKRANLWKILRSACTHLSNILVVLLLLVICFNCCSNCCFILVYWLPWHLFIRITFPRNKQNCNIILSS